jgi:hypothetical protein
MWRGFLLGVVALSAVACGQRPIRAELPARLDMSSLDADAQSAVLDAADDWYVATDGLADVTNEGASQRIVVSDIDNEELLGETVQDDDGTIRIGLHLKFSRSLKELHAARSEGFDVTATDIVRFVMKHELGHAFTLDHVAHTLMDAGRFGGKCIDADTLERMCKSYSCPRSAHTTCD